MAKRTKPRRRRKNNFTLPLGIIAPLGKVGADCVQVGLSDGIGAGANHFTTLMTGYNIDTKDFKVSRLYRGLFPVLGGVLLHKAAGRLGINRALASAGVPWLRI